MRSGAAPARGSEEFAKLTDSIYFHDNDALYVNLFIAVGAELERARPYIEPEDEIPRGADDNADIKSAPKQKTTLKIRVPYWATSGVTVR